ISPPAHCMSILSLRDALPILLLGAGVMVFYSGDILTVYAVVGTILLAMHRVDDRVALRTAGAIFAVVVLSMVVSAAFVDSSAFRSEEHTSELKSRFDLVCRLL